MEADVEKVDAGEVRSGKGVRLFLTIFLFVIVGMAVFVLSLKRPTTKISKPLQIGLPAPDFTFPDLNGNKVSLSEYRGKVVLVNIWATWCPPCREEMPSMQKLYDRFKGKDFEILAVSIDANGAKAVAPFMQELKLTFPALLDTKGRIRSLYGTTGVPESFIIDKNGILVQKVIGPLDWAKPEVFRFFEKLILKGYS